LVGEREQFVGGLEKLTFSVFADEQSFHKGLLDESGRGAAQAGTGA
jgi:hypothetical protein